MYNSYSGPAIVCGTSGLTILTSAPLSQNYPATFHINFQSILNSVSKIKQFTKKLTVVMRSQKFIALAIIMNERKYLSRTIYDINMIAEW